MKTNDREFKNQIKKIRNLAETGTSDRFLRQQLLRLTEQDRRERESAILALAGNPDPIVVDALIILTGDADPHASFPSVNYIAAKTLILLGGASVDRVIEYVGQPMVDREQSSMANFIIGAMGYSRDPRYIKCVLRILRGDIKSPSSVFSWFADGPALAKKLIQPVDEISKCVGAQWRVQLPEAMVNEMGECMANYDIKVNCSRDFGAVVGIKRRIDGILLDGVNKLIQGPSIYDAKGFSELLLRPETRHLLSMRLEGAALFYFNRLLFEDAFPRETNEIICYMVDGGITAVWLWVKGDALVPYREEFMAAVKYTHDKYFGGKANKIVEECIDRLTSPGNGLERSDTERTG